jgi:hypothetical protein
LQLRLCGDQLVLVLSLVCDYSVNSPHGEIGKYVIAAVINIHINRVGRRRREFSAPPATQLQLKGRSHQNCVLREASRAHRIGLKLRDAECFHIFLAFTRQYGLSHSVWTLMVSNFFYSRVYINISR